MKTLNPDGTLLITSSVRLSYLSVFRPRKNALRNDEEEYSCTLLIPKTPNTFCPDPEAILNGLREAAQKALILKFKEVPKKYTDCLLDGDVETDNDGESKHPGYWFLSTRAGVEYPPVLLDGKRAPVLDAKAWVSGDWGNVKLSFFGYDFKDKKGVSAGLRAIQFTKKDEPFGSDQSPEATRGEFDEVEEDFLS